MAPLEGEVIDALRPWLTRAVEHFEVFADDWQELVEFVGREAWQGDRAGLH